MCSEALRVLHSDQGIDHDLEGNVADNLTVIAVLFKVLLRLNDKAGNPVPWRLMISEFDHKIVCSIFFDFRAPM